MSCNWLDRRQFLSEMSHGLQGIALTVILAEEKLLAGARQSHFPAKAKRVIQIFCPGGVSAMDTFDYKPMLEKHQGQRPELVDRKSLRNTKNGLLKSPFGFKRISKKLSFINTSFALSDSYVPAIESSGLLQPIPIRIIKIVISVFIL